MKHTAQLAVALHVVSTGSEAIRHAALATDAVPGMALSPEFTYNAVTAPLYALAGLLGVERNAPASNDKVEPLAAPEPAPPTRVRRQAKRRKAAPMGAIASGVAPRKPAGRLPEPPDLGGFERRAHQQQGLERAPYSADADQLRESSSCRALLLEVVRRAAYDWVLYRQSSKLQNRVLAESAFHWLFQEEQGSSEWSSRTANGKELTGLIAICELLELDVARVRDKIRQMTLKDIVGSGRPAERRRKRGNASDDVMQSDDLPVFDVNVDNLPSFDPMFPAMDG